MNRPNNRNRRWWIINGCENEWFINGIFNHFSTHCNLIRFHYDSILLWTKVINQFRTIKRINLNFYWPFGMTIPIICQNMSRITLNKQYRYEYVSWRYKEISYLPFWMKFFKNTSNTKIDSKIIRSD